MKNVCAMALLLVSFGVVAADEAADKKLLKELEGSYTPTTMTRGGEAAPDEFLKTLSISIKGDTFIVRFNKDKKGEDKNATIKLNASKKPAEIDLTPTDGPEKGKAMPGLVKIEKDTVTLCWADRDEKAERPKDFTSTKENKQFLIVMKKTK